MRTLRRIALLLAVAIDLGLAASTAVACDEHTPGAEPTKATLSRPTPWLDGELREVDVDEGTLALGHGKITRWRMEAMSSMVFKARDSALLAKLKPGDKVKFRAAMLGQQPMVTEIRPAN